MNGWKVTSLILAAFVAGSVYTTACGTPMPQANAQDGGTSYPNALQCEQWEVKAVNNNDDCDEEDDFGGGDKCVLPEGWEPMNIEFTGAATYLMYLRRCTSVAE